MKRIKPLSEIGIAITSPSLSFAFDFARQKIFIFMYLNLPIQRSSMSLGF